MRLRPICKPQIAPCFMIPLCEKTSYPVLAVLAIVSDSYPDLTGRLPTCYSHVHHYPPDGTARLTCIGHAASVRPEPLGDSRLSLLPQLANFFLIPVLVVMVNFLVMKLFSRAASGAAGAAK
ncbi:hypothetical protein J2T18_004632 [Paenibacillus polymyxa]|nr:hypothetical protein [Paenibacillus polymyxa]